MNASGGGWQITCGMPCLKRSNLTTTGGNGYRLSIENSNVGSCIGRLRTERFIRVDIPLLYLQRCDKWQLVSLNAIAYFINSPTRCIHTPNPTIPPSKQQVPVLTGIFIQSLCDFDILPTVFRNQIDLARFPPSQGLQSIR